MHCFQAPRTIHYQIRRSVWRVICEGILGHSIRCFQHQILQTKLAHLFQPRNGSLYMGQDSPTVYPKKYAHGFCFAVLCCGFTLIDFPISIRLTSLALWQSNDCPSASKATLMNMDKYFMWIHYERLHNHNKVKHNKTVCTFLGIYCMGQDSPSTIDTVGWLISISQQKWSGSKCMGLKPLVDENALHNRFRHKFVRNMS